MKKSGDRVPEQIKKLEASFAVKIARPKNADDFLQTEFEVPKKIISGLLEKGTVTALVARSKLGKSQFMLQLACHIAYGCSFGSLKIRKPRKVLYVDFELRGVKFQQRLLSILEEWPFLYPLTSLDPDQAARDGKYNLLIKCLRDEPDREKLMTNPQYFFDWIAKVVKGDAIDLVVIDPIYLLLNGSENDNEVWMEVITQISKLLALTGVAVLYIHHMKKGSHDNIDDVDAGQGSGVATRFVDQKIVMVEHHDPQHVIVRPSVTRDGPPLDPFVLRREGSRFVYDENALVIPSTQRTKEAHQKREAEDQIMEDLRVELRRIIAKDGSCRQTFLKDRVITKYRKARETADRLLRRLRDEVTSSDSDLTVKEVQKNCFVFTARGPN